ncbi:MAG: hypothetical protein VX438_05495 [Planctomycetota bacterium]|nr:hypothetical protein [Planctomycetota bacterium]
MNQEIRILFIFGLMIITSNVVVAQDYQVMPLAAQFDLEKIKAEPEMNGDLKKAKAALQRRKSIEDNNAREIFRTGAINDRFRGYYTQVIVPELTRYDRDSLQNLTSKHQRLIKDYATRVRNNDVRRYLVTQVYFPLFRQIVDGNYHPVVRYNALLHIGKLDAVVGKNGMNPPTPFPSALPYLIQKYNRLNDPQLAYFKYGAFKGIARIAAIDFQKPTPSDAGTTKPVFTALLGNKPATLDEDLFRSMQRTSVQVLSYLGDPANIDAFSNLIKDAKTPIWTKADTAIALSKLKTNTFDATKLEATATSIATFMHEILRNEVKALEYQQQRIAILAARKKEVSLDGISRGSSSSAGSS